MDKTPHNIILIALLSLCRKTMSNEKEIRYFMDVRMYQRAGDPDLVESSFVGLPSCVV